MIKEKKTNKGFENLKLLASVCSALTVTALYVHKLSKQLVEAT